MATKSLKDGITLQYIAPYLLVLGIVQSILVGFDLSSNLVDLERILSAFPIGETAAFTGVIFIVGVSLQNLLPRSTKEVVIFWRLQERLPGFRAFSQHPKLDERIDRDAIIAAGGVPDLSPNAQNALWYKWYRSYQDRPSVTQAHRHYLAFRDLGVVALLTSPLVLGFMAWNQVQTQTYVTALAIPVVTYLVSVTVARNKSHEMMSHVLALKGSE